MMIRFLLISLFSFCFALIIQAKDLRDSIITPGILAARLDLLDSLNRNFNIKKPLLISKTDGDFIDSLIYPIDEEPKFENQIAVRAYYPQHYVLYFDSFPIEKGKYKIFCNNNWCFVAPIEGITEYLTWEEYIRRVLFFDTTNKNPIRTSPSQDSVALDLDYNEVFFEAISVEHEWIYVRIFEGENIIEPMGEGWLKWRDGNILLLRNLYYSV